MVIECSLLRQLLCGVLGLLQQPECAVDITALVGRVRQSEQLIQSIGQLVDLGLGHVGQPATLLRMAWASRSSVLTLSRNADRSASPCSSSRATSSER